MTNKEYWYWLCNIDKLGSKKVKALLSYFESPENMYKASEEEITRIINLKEEEKVSIINSKNKDIIQSGYGRLIERNIEFIHIEDEKYPDKLRKIEGAPNGIYLKGNLPNEKTPVIAIIGARNCSNYGKEVTRYISSELSKQGIQIVSGAARGIDSYAHMGALNVKASTYGVLGCGLNICYPAENFQLYEEIANKGGLISEYNLGVPPLRINFPMRNRIISGLSDGIIVIEAKEKSGSNITVDFGLEQGKDIYCIPGRINDELSKGTNNLIKMGAKLITSPEDVLEEYNLKNNKNIKKLKKSNYGLDNKEKIVYANLSLEPKHIEELIIDTNLSVKELTEVLMSLELKDYIQQSFKNYYTISV